MSKNSVLTNRGDPGVTQSNPGKVALDGPFLNGLKEEPRNILAKGTQGPPPLPPQEGAQSLYTAFTSTENACPLSPRLRRSPKTSMAR